MVDYAPSYDPPRATVLLYLDGDLDHFERVLETTDIILEFGDGRGYAYTHSEPHPIEWKLFEIATDEGLLPVFPIQYHHDGSLSTRLVGPPERLQSAVAAIPEGVEASIEKVGEYTLGRPPIPPGLPRRQREALAVAFDRGYYDVPKSASRDDVAAALECAPSTASEHLQKAERSLVETFLGHHR